MKILDIITLVIFAAIAVLFIKNPKGSAAVIGSSSDFVQGETNILTGSGYKGGN